ncbi:MAG: DNA cytosine methyltransferase [Pseudomonadota bacterium]
MGLIIDSFAGGGGASTGITRALGRSPDIAINHDADALAMHEANHPETRHVNSSVYAVDIRDLIGGEEIDLLWASPDCKHFSKAKGGKPVAKHIRDLAWVIVHWCEVLHRSRRGEQMPKVILLENVEEFRDWGPLGEDGKPDPLKKGHTFTLWWRRLRALGYKVKWRELRACDYGAPTIRKRFFLVARRDGHPIVWPEPTHAAPGSDLVKAGTLKAHRTAAEIIDWSLPCPSIFDTSEEILKKSGIRAKRPLAEATLRRIAKGVKRYVLDAVEPFIVTCNHQGEHFCGQGLDQPFCTVTANRDAHGLIVPTLAPFVSYAQHGGRCRDARDPLHTVTASTKDQNCVVVPTLVQTGYGERDGQSPRVPGLEKPLGTIVAGGSKHALVAAFLAQHNGGMVGHDAREPVSTITMRGTQQNVVAAHLLSLKGSARRDRTVDAPLATVCAGGGHAAMVSAFMVKYYGPNIGQELHEPLHTVTSRDRFGLITVEISGETFVIADIGMRMLTPRELYRAQGFPDDYVIEQSIAGRAFTKTAQIRMCGNSVPPDLAFVLAKANSPYAEQVANVA